MYDNDEAWVEPSVGGVTGLRLYGFDLTAADVTIRCVSDTPRRQTATQDCQTMIQVIVRSSVTAMRSQVSPLAIHDCM